jgi:hypothetical protein
MTGIKEEETFQEPTCKCGTVMVMQGSWATKEEDYALYQCPKCKTIELKELHLI